MIYPLTTLDNAKQWLGVGADDDDAFIGRLITSISNAIMQFLDRPALARSPYNEFQNGVGNNVMMLKNWPVISVGSIQTTACGSAGSYGGFGLGQPQVIPAAPSWGQSGYYLTPGDGTLGGQPQSVMLSGYQFPRGRANIQVSYQAGYCIQAEPAVVPSLGPYNVTPVQPLGSWVQDDGVTYANGTPLTRVSSNPTVGTYAVAIDDDSENLLVANNWLSIPNLLLNQSGEVIYSFNSADAGEAILLSYSFTPFDIEQACIEWVGERYRYRDRIGQASKSLGGQETASYSLKAIPDFVVALLSGYRKQFPI